MRDGVWGNKSWAWDNSLLYTTILRAMVKLYLKVHCYQKSLIRRGHGWGRREAVFVQGYVGGGKLLYDLPTQSVYTCAPLELCTRVELNACIQIAWGNLDNCRVGGAEPRVS